MRVLSRLLGIVTLAALFTVGVGSASAAYPSPQAMLYSYYSSINRADYASAYNLWLAPSQSYQNFASGFSLTTRVEPYFGEVQLFLGADPRVPAVLLGYQTGGNVVAYYGCFFVRDATGAGDWRLTGGNFRLIRTLGVPTGATISGYLPINCFDLASNVIPATMPTGNGEATILNYFDAINRKDFQSAYANWLAPIPGPKPNGQPAQDYRLPFNRFATGYADTTYINVYLGTYVRGIAFAGHGYLDGSVPVVLVAQHTDGSFNAFYGCYVIGFFLDGRLGIVNGSFKLLTNGAPSGSAILSALNLDCTSLAIPV
jgi:hypothetical protein